ncbi:DUF4153 domain-containing protein [Peptoniphilus equinus]|uniref:DUF4153 domain-containing protein n=1 Tax=Peptoniphilus equinus TaxID=3016343 RepID=A0ABY7QX59_9FIRM|nr:DUF4153 domain-containing protein [Peptoniphilus equinus]WBW50518.1 DUF4153 domain-containing protein [Peptoniphilus equinus]
MRLVNSIKSTLMRSKSSFTQFPATMFAVVIAAFAFMMAVGSEPEGPLSADYFDVRVGYLFVFIAVAGLFVNLAIHGIMQKDALGTIKEKNRLIILGFVTAFMLAVGSIGVVLFSSEGMLFQYEMGYIYFGALLATIIGCFYVARFWFHKDFVTYTVKIVVAGMISLGYSTVLLIGMFSIYFALRQLFGLDVGDTTYMRTAIFLYLPFNVGIFLSNYPKANASYESFKLDKVVVVLIHYILIPIFVVYAAILYLYFGKVIFTAEVPNNILADLVLWFSLFEAAFVYLLKAIDDVPLINGFRKWMPVAMLPLLGMLFYAIFLRIGAYAMTENRYFVIMAAIFVLLSNLYYIFYRAHSNIVVPVVLSLMILISTIGPLSAYNMAARSQNLRLENLLRKNNMLQNAEVMPTNDLSEEDRQEIFEIVDYMSNHHHAYELSFVPKDYRHTDDNFAEVFGFEPVIARQTYNDGDVSYYAYDNLTAIDISGFNQLIDLSFSSDIDDDTTFNGYRVYSSHGEVVVARMVNKNYVKVFSFTMKDVIDKVKVLQRNNINISPEELAITGEHEGIRYKVLFTQASQYGVSNTVQDVRFYLMVE